MAQAVRLNLRMQKELKILLTDPPPGATFPSLSPQSSSSPTVTLTSIDAQIDGPEGTVYEKGVFKLKIQIPERYPFQPPILMFATPIYHPNIDNGGRICLDILNLPPKGAWQPSLNISTVLTSIGLLLSEPNPDDGLMQEASREYKYNRQAFDQKARSITEKYASAGSVEIASGEQERETPSELNKDLTENMESAMSIKSVSEYSTSNKRLHGVSKKLSLEASESDQRMADRKEVNQSFDLPTKKKIKRLLKESKLTPTDHNQPHKNLKFTKRKLQLGFKPVENCDNLIKGKPDQYSPLSEPQAVTDHSSKCWSVGQSDSSPRQNFCGNEDNLATRKSIMKDEQLVQITEKDDNKLCSASLPSLNITVTQPIAASLPEKNYVRASEEHRNSLTSIRHKKLGLTGRRLPLEKASNRSFKSNDKENLAPRSSILFPQQKENFDLLSSLSEKSIVGHCFDVCKQKETPHSIHNSTVTGQRRPSHSSDHCGNVKQSNTELERQSECSFQDLKHTFHCKSGNEKELQTNERDEKFVSSIENQEEAVPDSVVVLDSEESDDEKVINARSKLSLARRYLPVKRKS